MADPLSISSGIAGILALAGSIVSTCYSYVKLAKEGQAEVQTLIEEIVSLAGVLNAVKSLVDRATESVVPETGPKSQSSTIALLPPPYSILEAREHFKQLQGPIEGSQRALEDVRNALQKADVRRETNKLGRVIKRLQWPLKRDETMNLVGRLERYKSLYLLALDTTNVSMTMDMQQKLDGIRQTQLIDQLERRMAEQADKQQKITSWLCPVNCADAHRAARHAHLQGTGGWILEDPAWQAWLQADRSFLWLYGIPGSGKTVMTSTLLDHCEQLDADRRTCLAYFYCDFRDKDSMRAKVVLGALVAQLAAQSNGPVPELDEFMKSHTWQGKEWTQPTCEELQELLVTLFARIERAIVIIDALDECADRGILLNLLTMLPNLKDTHVKVLVSSRQELDIETALASFNRLSSRVEAQSADIEFYVSCCMAKSGRLQRLPSELRETVRSTLVRQACGMFRWVQCQIEALDRVRTDRDIRRALHQLPSTLYGAYERILERIEEQDRTIARRALLWLAYGPRMLTLGELAEAVVIEDDTHRHDPEAAWLPTDVLSVIGSLARYSTESDRVELAHHSVKEFLETATLPDSLAFFHLEAQSGRTELTQRMLTYLLMDEFQTTCGSREAYQARLEAYPLFHLAARYWAYYAHDTLPNSWRTRNLACGLLAPQRSPQFRSWAEALISQGPNSFRKIQRLGVDTCRSGPLHPTRSSWLPCPDHLTPLYYAASFGLCPVVQSLLDAGVDVNERGGLFKGTPLHSAIFREHVDVVRLLLDRGANVDVRDGRGVSAWEMGWKTIANSDIEALLSAHGHGSSRGLTADMWAWWSKPSRDDHSSSSQRSYIRQSHDFTDTDMNDRGERLR